MGGGFACKKFCELVQSTSWELAEQSLFMSVTQDTQGQQPKLHFARLHTFRLACETSSGISQTVAAKCSLSLMKFLPFLCEGLVNLHI